MTQTLAAIVIVAFASYRLAHVIASDTITEPFRLWVYGRGHNELPTFVVEPTEETGDFPLGGRGPELYVPLGNESITAADLDVADLIRSGTITPREFEIETLDERKPGSSATAWRWFYGLVSCPFCCGWWFSIAGWWAYTGQFLESRAWAVQAVAVAGVQSALPGRS